MKSKLEQLEHRLKNIIEASAALFGRNNRQEQLARQLAAALYEQLPARLSERSVAPDQFTIYLHPENLSAWQQPQWIDWLEQVINEALQDAGFQAMLRPSIQLASAMDLSIDQLRVIAVHSSDSLGSTAAMPVTSELSPASLPADSMPANAYLIVQGMQTVAIHRPIFNIGRRSDNDLVLDDPRVSRTHLQIRAIRGHFVLFDLNSTGGTLVNGNPISEHLLSAGDVIVVGGVALIYGEDAPAWPEDARQTTSPMGS